MGAEWIWVIVAVVVLFGASRLPAMGRNVGLGIKEFKRGITEGGKSDKSEEGKDRQQAQAGDKPEAGA